MQSKLAKATVHRDWLDAALAAVLGAYPEALLQCGTGPPGSRVAAMQRGPGSAAGAAASSGTASTACNGSSGQAAVHRRSDLQARRSPLPEDR